MVGGRGEGADWAAARLGSEVGEGADWAAARLGSDL